MPPAVFVTGKGGVGKTTVAGGLAVAAAERGQQALFLEFGDGQSGRRVLRGAPAHVEHVVIRLDQAARRAATPLFGSALLAKVALGNFAMKPLLRAAPAIRELAVLELVRQEVAAHPGARVVVDMPATGHTLSWLRVAEQGRDLVRRGPLFDLCDRLMNELLHPGRATVVVVTLPERLVLSETAELCEALKSQVGLNVGRLIVNRVPAALEPQALEDARRLAAAGGETARAAQQVADLLALRAGALEEVMQTLRQELGEDTRAMTLPNAPVDPSAATVAQWLAEQGAT